MCCSSQEHVCIKGLFAVIAIGWGLAANGAFGQTTPPILKTEIILDASGSMNAKMVSGQTKIEAAKNAVQDLAAKILDDTWVALRVYGHRFNKEQHNCEDTELLVPFAPLAANREKIKTKAKGITARGWTPITYVLGVAAADFTGGDSGVAMIILVSDGKETCPGDPCATAAALAKQKAGLVVHTIGFGVDAATRAQLECLARSTGGQYFPADKYEELVLALQKAVKTDKQAVSKASGEGWLEVKGAGLAGHEVTRAATGERVGVISQIQSTLSLPSGIYNVAFGKAIWKSVEIKPKQKTVLNPAVLTVKSASLHGHPVVEAETGQEQGAVSSLHDTITLIPGQYEVLFGKIAWPVALGEGQFLTLQPGVVSFNRAGSQGHKIRNLQGQVVGEVSNISSVIPLPPGDYTIEIDSKTIPFSLAEGQKLEFGK